VSPITSAWSAEVLLSLAGGDDPGELGACVAGACVSDDGKRQKELTGLLRKSAKLRKMSDELAARAQRLRGEIATSTKGRVVERRTKARLRGK
jgi:hypothetical protein